MTPVPHKVGVYLALLQLIFTLCWVVYAIYLPRLAAQVGIPAGAVIFLLMLDQAIFTIFDVATGVAADRVSRMIGRLGRLVAAATIISCAAFLALPFVAGAGPIALPVFIALTVIWAVTSSALRAPPIMLLGKYAAAPALPYLSSLAMLGYGLAGAAAPYLALTLRELDPRLPFAAASVALVLTTLGLAHVERLLARRPAQPAAAKPSGKVGRIAVRPIIFAVAMVVLALGYQLHFAINTVPLFRRFTDSVDHLLPVFWIGFNVAMFPATLLVKRWGGFTVMGLFGVVGALAIFVAEIAGALDLARRRPIRRRRLLGLHPDERLHGRVCGGEERDRRQDGRPALLGAGLGDLRAHGGDRRRPAARMDRAAAMGADHLLGNCRRCAALSRSRARAEMGSRLGCASHPNTVKLRQYQKKFAVRR